MKIWARQTVEADFTNKELELLIDASLNGNRIEEASKLLAEKFGGEGGYMSEAEIQYQAFEYDKDKYRHASGFCDIEWGWC